LFRLLAIGLAVCWVVNSAQASAAIVIPAGGQAVLPDGQFNACDHLVYGYILNGGPRNPVDMNQPPTSCSTFSSTAHGTTIGPFSTPQTLVLYVSDLSCTELRGQDVTYLSDGSSTVSSETGTVDHATVSGTNPYSVAINDGGPDGCVSWDVNSQPPAGSGNFDINVQINVAPALSVTAPSPPAGQNGFFNIRDVAADGGAIPVQVLAQDAAAQVPRSLTALSCLDDGAPTAVTHFSGGATATGTVLVSSSGAHTISCTATDAAGLTTTSTTGLALDTGRPSLALPGSPDIVVATGPDGARVASYPVSASDPDPGDSAPVVCNPAAPAQFPIGDTTVTCSSTDHAGNSINGQFVLRVAQRQTSTSVTCSPNTLATGKSAACTATIADLSGPAKVIPSGSICFFSDSPGVFGDGGQSCMPTGSSATCKLENGSTTCTEPFTPSSYKPGTTYAITASYSGDTTYSGSVGPTSIASSPQAGVAAGVTVVSGTVFIFVKRPAGERDMDTGAAMVAPLKGETVAVPVGSTIDARKGVIRLSTAGDYMNASDPAHTVQTGTFSVAIFTVEQLSERQALARSRIRRARLLKMRPPTDLVLDTPQGAAAQARCRRTGRPGHGVVREFSGFARGLYRTIGAASITTVSDAHWAVIDRCDGTETEVGSGRATVTPRHPKPKSASSFVVGPGQRLTIKGRFL
jgi:hypothetical protein